MSAATDRTHAPAESMDEPGKPEAPGRAPHPADGVVLLAAKQLAVLAREAPRVMIGDDPDAVHDVRVATRRLQDALAVLDGIDDGPAVDGWRRTLRRTRRALGEWRNLDVVLAELNERRRRTRSTKRRDAFAAVRAELERMRVDESVAARKRLRRADLEALCESASLWLSARRPVLEPAGIRSAVADRLSAGWRGWQDAHARALQAGTVPAVHALRIATKRLRYRAELAAAIEPEAARPVSAWTRNLQEALGDWHDRQVLHELLARVLGGPDFLLGHLEAAEILLGEIRRERTSSHDPVEQLPRGALLEAGEAAIAELLRRVSAL